MSILKKEQKTLQGFEPRQNENTRAVRLMIEPPRRRPQGMNERTKCTELYFLHTQRHGNRDSDSSPWFQF